MTKYSVNVFFLKKKTLKTLDLGSPSCVDYFTENFHPYREPPPIPNDLQIWQIFRNLAFTKEQPKFKYTLNILLFQRKESKYVKTTVNSYLKFQRNAIIKCIHPREMNIKPAKGVQNKAKGVWKVHKLQLNL